MKKVYFGWRGGVRCVGAMRKRGCIVLVNKRERGIAFYGLAADRQEYCFTKDFYFFYYFF